MRAENTNAKQTAMNQSMAVAYETLGRECRALMLRVVMVSTVVMPENKDGKKHLFLVNVNVSKCLY